MSKNRKKKLKKKIKKQLEKRPNAAQENERGEKEILENETAEEKCVLETKHKIDKEFDVKNELRQEFDNERLKRECKKDLNVEGNGHDYGDVNMKCCDKGNRFAEDEKNDIDHEMESAHPNEENDDDKSKTVSGENSSK